MTSALLTIRILASIATVWAYVAFQRQLRRETKRRAVREWLETAIRGAK